MATDRVSFPTVAAGRCEEGTRIRTECIDVADDGSAAAFAAVTAVAASTHNNSRVHSITPAVDETQIL